jgi:hypothetical protein
VPFTPAQKLRLMAAYAPVLYLHRDERFVPISPTAYLERAALWDDLAPGSHLRESWGHPTEGGGGLRPPPAFPRAPLLRPGQLTVTPAAAGGDVHFLGEPDGGAFPFTQSDAERALFLDYRGWWEEGEPADFANDPGDVRETTQNRLAFVDRLAQSWGLWRPEDPAEPIPPEVAMLEPFRRRLSADVHAWQSLAVAASEVDPNLISMLSKIASHAGNANLWFIFYHFFYPAHEEELRWCEFVALLNNLGESLPGEVPAAGFDAGGDLGDLVGLHRADYAGDWSTVCVIVRGRPEWMPTAGGSQVLPNDNAQLPPPSYVGFGRRARSLMSDEGRYTFDQLMPVTDEFGVVGERHVKVFAGLGTHNNFATPGQHLSPRNESVLDTACDVNGTDADSDAPVDEKHRKRRLALLGVLKILMGLLLGLPVWPEAGAIALGLESIRGHDPEGGFEDEPTEQAAPSEPQAMIIAPAETLGELALPPEQAWQTAGNDLIDGQIWWPPPLGPAEGYHGAWGVTCAEDPFDARSGMPFPDARAKLIESLALLLEKD